MHRYAKRGECEPTPIPNESDEVRGRYVYG